MMPRTTSPGSASASRCIPLNRGDDKGRLAWVCEGVKDAGTAAGSFHTDGTLYVFSTLRPAAGPPGSLVVRTVDHRILSGRYAGDFLAAIVAEVEAMKTTD